MKPIKGIVFDLYGTLFDVHSVAELCDKHYPGRGLEVSALWRQKQLEYTWLRSLMGQYLSFEEATRDGLVFTCKRFKLDLPDATRVALCQEYLQLKPYPETPAALAALQAMGLPLAILSNGSVRSIRSVVGYAGLEKHFAHLISVEAVKVFKPDFRVYELAEKTLGLGRSDILFVSSNPWDASGAKHFGYTVCWVNRNDNVFEELGAAPDIVVKGLDALVDQFGGHAR